MIRKVGIVGLMIALMLAFQGCFNQNVQGSNFSQVYGTKNVTITPDYVIYHQSNDESRIYFQFNSGQVLYARKDKSQPYQSKVKIHYEAYAYDNKKELLDSASVMIYDTVEKKVSKVINGELDLKLKGGKKYYLRVFATDLNRNNTFEKLLTVDKVNHSSSQFYLIRNKQDSSIFYNNYVIDPVEVVVHSEVNKGEKIYANQYFRSFPIASPPFAHANHKAFNYQPDERHKVIISDEGTFEYLLLDTGFVHFVLDTSQKDGLTVFGFENNYPEIKNVFGMVAPLRFISSNNEFDELNNAEDTKKAVDLFWLAKSGDEDRGREVIKRYYNRVQDANDNFTSYVEGWKTDRGMISIIYGTPKSVRVQRDEEIWYYGEETNSFSLQFTFMKVDNPFTNNDFKLVRATSYKSSWYRAVDVWRSGRAYWAQY
jgi:GWxTD domain-containing protein